jgi:hypothetical protein
LRTSSPSQIHDGFTTNVTKGKSITAPHEQRVQQVRTG